MRALVIAAVVLAACRAPVRGTYRVNYPTGGPHWEYETVDDVPHGRGRVWHSNGELQSEGPYDDGKKHGEFVFWDASGEFEHRAFFWKNVEVWRSRVYQERPPKELLDGLAAYTAAQAEREPRGIWRFSTSAPAPYFASLDRTTSLNRVGVQLGFGESGELRSELFGNHAFGRFGVYGQLSQTSTDTMSNVRLSGRRTVEAGATYQLSIAGLGKLSPRAGVLVPIGNDNSAGFLASTLGAFQRPTDAATSVPATAALRTGASLTRGGRRFVAQLDGGVDWLLGGRDAPVDAMLRANVGVGVGVRSLLFSVELSNAVRASDPALRVHAVGLGGTLWLDHVSLTSLLTHSLDGHTAFTGGIAYEL